MKRISEENNKMVSTAKLYMLVPISSYAKNIHFIEITTSWYESE